MHDSIEIGYEVASAVAGGCKKTPPGIRAPVPSKVKWKPRPKWKGNPPKKTNPLRNDPRSNPAHWPLNTPRR